MEAGRPPIQLHGASRPCVPKLQEPGAQQDHVGVTMVQAGAGARVPAGPQDLLGLRNSPWQAAKRNSGCTLTPGLQSLPMGPVPSLAPHLSPPLQLTQAGVPLSPGQASCWVLLQAPSTGTPALWPTSPHQLLPGSTPRPSCRTWRITDVHFPPGISMKKSKGSAGGGGEWLEAASLWVQEAGRVPRPHWGAAGTPACEGSAFSRAEAGPRCDREQRGSLQGPGLAWCGRSAQSLGTQPM